MLPTQHFQAEHLVSMKGLHCAKWSTEEHTQGKGKVRCLAPAAINTECTLEGQLFTAAGLCPWPDSKRVMLTAGL